MVWGSTRPPRRSRSPGRLPQPAIRIADMPGDPQALIERLLAGPTNARPGAAAEETFSFADYSAFFATLAPSVQRAVAERWGPGERDPFFREGRLDCGRFAIPGFRCGNVAIVIQPARGYNIDPKATYHDPALVPPHGYFAAYAWLAQEFRADAIIHLGKHGTLEWLPGKALAVSAECFPEAVMPPLPHLYPFIVNDPGEGTQAKRRAQAVIVDHLTPPLARAGSYGLMAELERLVDEYYEAAQGDVRRVAPLAAAILEQARAAGLDGDCGIAADEAPATALRKLDGFLCELKELQIRDGLHVFGESPEGGLLDGLLVAFARPARGARPEDMSLLRALAADLGLGGDPLALDPAEPWTGPRPKILAADLCPLAAPGGGEGRGEVGESTTLADAHLTLPSRCDGPLPLPPEGRRGEISWRTAGDTVERLGGAGAAACRRRGTARTGVEPDPGGGRLDRVLVAAGGRGMRCCRDRRTARRPRRAVCRARPIGRAEPRPARGVADRAQFLFARHPRGADAGGLASSAGNRRRCWSNATPRNMASIRRGWHCRLGAPPICAPAATTLHKPWP